MTSEIPLQSQRQSLVFHGDGGNYFGLWLKNIFLSIITLGIYSAWARVHTLRYFYSNTELAGDRFSYHARPLRILTARLLILLGLMILQGALLFNPVLGYALIMLFVLLLPWIMVRQWRFAAQMSSFRGVHFNYHCRIGRSYWVFLGWPLMFFATLVLVGILMSGLLGSLSSFALAVSLPLVIIFVIVVGNGISSALIADLYVNDAHFGILPFSVLIDKKTFVIYALKAVLISLLFTAGGVVLIVIFFLKMAQLADELPAKMLIMLAVYNIASPMLGLLLIMVGIMIARAYAVVAHRNYVFNRAKLGGGRLYFASCMKVLPYLALLVTNVLMVIFSGGLATPFAQIRHARYMIETLDVVGDIDALPLQNHGEMATSALEEELMLGLDIQPGI